MLSIAWGWLESNYPNVFWGFLCLFIVSIIVWKLAKFHTECKNCRKVCDNEKGIKSKLSKLNDKLNTLIFVLSDRDVIDNSLFSTNSPLNLTKKGLELVEEIGWKEIVDNDSERKKLFDELDCMKVSSRSDVEKYCLVLLYELNSRRDDNLFVKVRKYLYEHAHIADSDAIFACALYLREAYLKERTDIKE
jgi:hypothetical protein